MVVDAITACTKGPQGPETIRAGQSHWGKFLEEAFAGNDDEGFVEKTRIIGKHTFLASTVLLIFDVNMYNRHGGIPNILQRMKFHYTPWLGATVAYTSTVCCVSALRGGKTDQKNHAAGAVAVGTVIGKCAKSFVGGMVSAFFLGCVAWHYKDSKMRGYEVFTDIWSKNARHGNPFSHKMDYTTNWFPQRPGYWARSGEEVEQVFKQGQMGDGNHYTKRW